MSLATFSIHYPTLRLLLKGKLRQGLEGAILLKADSLLHDGESQSYLSLKKQINSKNIPLNRLQQKSGLEYLSALAFSLADAKNPPLGWAKEIVHQLNLQSQELQLQTSTFKPVADQTAQNLMISVVGSGWIHLRLTDSGVAEWLQCLVCTPWEQIEASEVAINTLRKTDFKECVDPQAPAVFKVLYTYARCCGMLRLAVQEALIQPFDSEASLTQPLPWLQSTQLRAQQPQDWAFIFQISDAIDYLAQSAADPKPGEVGRALKVAERFSQSCQTFQAACPLGGLAQAEEQALAQVRLGLIQIGRSVLKVLIQSRLGLTAYAAL